MRYLPPPGKARKAFTASLESPARAASTVSASVIAFSLMTLSSFPGYSIQFVSAGIENLPAAVIALAQNSYSSGLLGISITTVYAGLIGVAVTNIGVQIRNRQLSGGTAASMGPGFLAAGCAGCGAGLAGFLGFAGALALLPFNGTGVRVAGILLLLYFIALAGDPEECGVSA